MDLQNNHKENQDGTVQRLLTSLQLLTIFKKNIRHRYFLVFLGDIKWEHQAETGQRKLPRLSEKNSASHQSVDKLEPNFLRKLKLVPDFNVGGYQNFKIWQADNKKERTLIIMQRE